MSLIQSLYDLELDQTEILHQECVDDVWITVRQYENFRWLSVAGDMMQSLMDVNQPEALFLPNLQTMLICLDILDEPVNCLNVGAGAGCIDRFLAHARPSLQVKSLESNSHIIQIAKEYFNMPAEYCIQTDIESYLNDKSESFDVILFDIYSAEKNPDCLYSDKFHKDLFSIMAEKSVLALNLMPESEEDLLGILKPMNQYAHVLLLHQVPNYENVIVYAIRNEQLSMQQVMEIVEIFNQQNIDIDILSQNY